MAKRKQAFTCKDNYLNLGFTLVEVNGEVRPQCIICLEVLAHSSLKEVKLQRHLKSKHSKYVDKSCDFFKNEELYVKRSHMDCPATWSGVAYSHSKAVKTSFTVTWKIARAKAAPTAEENLVKPAAIEMTRIMCGNAVANKLAMVSLSNNKPTHPRNIGRYSATNYCCCKTNWKI